MVSKRLRTIFCFAGESVRVVSLMVLLMLMMLLLVGVSCAPMIINYDGGGFTCCMDAH